MSEKLTIFERFPLLTTITKEKFPRHVFIIPDGNGRWAKERELPVTKGHIKGFQAAEMMIRDMSEISDIKVVTLWGFANDNWKRSETELKGLMLIFEKAIKKIITEFAKTNRRFVHLGRKDKLPARLIDLLQYAEEKTQANSGQILCFALDFGGEDQMVRMLEKAKKIQEPMTKELMYTLRDGKGIIPPADLIIRTSGEKRTSDVGWINGTSSELYFTNTYFPDMTTDEIVDALVDFSKRERRFGGRLK